MTAAATLSPADLAAELGTDPRTTRKFLRTITPREDQPGKGSRWAIKGTKAELTRLRKRFAEFEAAQAEAKAKRAEAKDEAPEVEAPSEVQEAEVDDFEDTLDTLEGPTDEELAELED